MTNTFKRRLKTTTLASFIAAVLLTASAFTGNAQSVSKAINGNTEVTISYKGMEDNLMLLLVQFDNTKGDKYVVKIEDKNHNNYYMENYKGLRYSKLFKVPADEGNLTLTFENTSNKAKTAFVTSSILRTYTDVAIKRIN
jgi:hypothetical protein